MKDLYSEKYNLRYYHAPKNGMTSMVRTLNLDWYDIDSQPNNIKTIAVIREPFDRFISSFLQTKDSVIRYDFNNINNPHKYRTVNINTLLDIFKSEPSKLVGKYIEEIKLNGFFDNHQLTQNFYFNEQHNRNSDNIDIFINFSNLEDELKSKLDNNLTVLRLNTKSKNEKDLYKVIHYAIILLGSMQNEEI